MNDSVESSKWLILIHRIPPKPDYLRVKARRRLHRIGAVPLKDSVYVLPAGDQALEDFQWLAREISTDGGEATVCEATFVHGTSDDELVAAFQAARDAEYAVIADAARDDAANADRLKRRLAEVAALDRFHAPGRADAEAAVSALEARAASDGAPLAMRTGTPRGATWVTRVGVHVDRIASAWLVRRFIDTAARFKFVSPKGYQPGPGELRFDMYEGEYTHQADRCTFETLLHRFNLPDPALVAIGEIVHTIDLKDDKYDRVEAAGVGSVLRGLTKVLVDDRERLERGAAIFEGLYAELRRR